MCLFEPRLPSGTVSGRHPIDAIRRARSQLPWADKRHPLGHRFTVRGGVIRRRGRRGPDYVLVTGPRHMPDGEILGE